VAWPLAACASGSTRLGSSRSSGTKRSPLCLPRLLDRFLQADIRAIDDGWRVMILEMLQGFFGSEQEFVKMSN
jgi:hypothetical protein